MIFNFNFFDRIFSWVEYENVIKIKRWGEFDKEEESDRKREKVRITITLIIFFY